MKEYNTLVNLITERLNDKGYDIYTEEEFPERAAFTDVDVTAYKDKYLLLFEVRTSEDLSTAIKHVTDIKRYYKKIIPKTRIFTFIAGYKDNEPYLWWYR